MIETPSVGVPIPPRHRGCTPDACCHVTSHSTIEKVHFTWMKRLVCFNLVSERYLHFYIMNPETNNIHALNIYIIKTQYTK